MVVVTAVVEYKNQQSVSARLSVSR